MAAAVLRRPRLHPCIAEAAVREEPAPPESPPASFGPYTLWRERHAVHFRGQPLTLDATGFGVLAALIERAGRPLAMAELRQALAPARAHTAGSLWNAVGALNQVLGAVAPDAGHVAHHPSEGFSLMLPRTAQGGATPAPALPVAPMRRAVRRRVAPVFGRDEVIERVAAQVQARRFVTIVGPGGMGKTTVALAAAERVGAGYADGVCLVDLAPLTEGSLVPSAVASALGMSASSGTFDLAVHLRQRQLLLVLDSCEPVVAAAATLVESIFAVASQVHVLATSREPLRAMGEWVYRLGPMRLPARTARISAAEAVRSPGIQLFVERARAGHAAFRLDDAQAPAVVGICQRLDGIPLAIELAAARVAELGVAGLAAQVDDRLLLLDGRRRDAPRRHRTLHTLLDWSHELLSPVEQAVLRRLSVFRGSFSMAAAAQVAADEQLAAEPATEALLDLVAKSLVTRVERGSEPEYRLLDTTRAYMADKLAAAHAEHDATLERHALCMRQLLTEAEAAWEHMTRAEWRAAYDCRVSDVRAALDWALSNPQTTTLGLELTSLSLTLADQTSLMTDFSLRSRRALDLLHRTPDVPPVLAIRLRTVPAYLSVHQGAQGQPLSSARKLLDALDIARHAGEPKHQAGPLTGLWVEEFQHGRYGEAWRWSRHMADVAQASGDRVLACIAQRTAAQTQHFMGHHDAARGLAEEVLASAVTIPLAYFPSAVDTPVSMRIVLARSLWMQGHAESAARVVEACLRLAEADTASALCQALALAGVPVAMWSGDLALTRHRLDQMGEHLQAYGFAYWRFWWETYDALYHRREGASDRAAAAPPDIAPAWAILHEHLPTLDPRFANPALLARARRGEATWCAPEILRVHAEGLRAHGSEAAAAEADALLHDALALARSQGALAWELRVAVSLADLWQAQGRAPSARDLLRGVRQRFTETGCNADLVHADARLRELDAATR